MTLNKSLFAKIDNKNKPSTFKEASKQECWMEAMKVEYEALMKNETWDLVPYPNEKNVIENKWIYKIKYNSDGEIEKYKARLVAKGFAQKYGIDYEETFAPVAKMPTVRIILSLSAAQGWKVFQLDVKSAFLNGDLDVEIYMNQPEGFIPEGKESFVCKLKKSLYGLKQAPRAWYKKISGFFADIGFSKCFFDSDLYVLNQGKDVVLIFLYVDDLLIIGNNDEIIQECISKLKATFEMTDLGLLHYYLGMQVYQYKDCTYLSQSKYISDILQKFGMEECRYAMILISPGITMSLSSNS